MTQGEFTDYRQQIPVGALKLRLPDDPEDLEKERLIEQLKSELRDTLLSLEAQIAGEVQSISVLHDNAASHLILLQVEEEISKGREPEFDRLAFWTELNRETDIVRFLESLDPMVAIDPNFLFTNKHDFGFWVRKVRPLKISRDSSTGGYIRYRDRAVMVGEFDDDAPNIWAWFNGTSQKEDPKSVDSFEFKIHELAHGYWVNHFPSKKAGILGIGKRGLSGVFGMPPMTPEIVVITEAISRLAERMSMFPSMNRIDRVGDLSRILRLYYEEREGHDPDVYNGDFDELSLALMIGLVRNKDKIHELSDDILINLRTLGDDPERSPDVEDDTFTFSEYLKAIKMAVFNDPDINLGGRAGVIAQMAMETVEKISDLRRVQLNRVMSEQLLRQNIDLIQEAGYFFLDGKNGDAFDQSNCVALPFNDFYVNVGVDEGVLDFQVYRREKEHKYGVDSSLTFSFSPRNSFYYRLDYQISEEERMKIVEELFSSRILHRVGDEVFFLGSHKILFDYEGEADPEIPTARLFSKDDVHMSEIFGDVREMGNKLYTDSMLGLTNAIKKAGVESTQIE